MLRHFLLRVILPFFLFVATVRGGGFQLYNEGSAEALGQASAITGRDDLTSLGWYNPAALAGTRQRSIMAGYSYVLLDSDFKGIAFNESMEEHWRSIPHAYYVQPIDDRKTLTLSVNSPYGLITEWPHDGSMRNLSEKAELVTVYATPSFAIKLTDQLSASAGINFIFAEAKLTDASREIKGDGTSVGGTAALHYKLTDTLSLGARYQSEVELSLDGELNSSIDTEAEATLPDSVTIGASYTGLPDWTFGLDAVWTQWSDFDKITYKFPTSTATTPENWQDVWAIHLGAEYRINDSWALRGGYIWDESPITDEYRSPMLPGSDLQFVTTGFGYRFKKWTLDAAYAYSWAKNTHQGTEIVAAAPAFAGEYENSAHLLSFSVGCKF